MLWSRFRGLGALFKGTISKTSEDRDSQLTGQSSRGRCAGLPVRFT